MSKKTAAPSIGLVELPEFGLFDEQGRNRTSSRRGSALISKQVLLANLQGYGYDAQLVNLKKGDYECDYGEVSWGKRTLTKVFVGGDIYALDAKDRDIWGLTCNFSQLRELTCMAIKHLAD
jgi:hypothetical protein